MLRIEARDGAAREGSISIGERTLRLPSIMWIDEELGAQEVDWTPIMSRRTRHDAAIVRTTAFTDGPSQAGPGQVLVRRELYAPPVMAPQRVRLLSAPPMSVFAGAHSLFRNPRRFAPMVAEARREAGYQNLLYAPGLGEPGHIALLLYAGIDVLDSAVLSLAAASGRFLTEHGSFPAKDLRDAECPCPACAGDAPSGMTEAELRRHNQYAARQELGAVRNAIRNARLRELVEARVRSHPELTALLRRLDQQEAYFEERTPLTRRSPLFATTKESLRRPEVLRFRRRVLERYQPRTEAPILVLLPCSHRKPYSRSRTHRAFADVLWETGAASLVHEAIVTSPLGLVPRELELTFPAAHYDVPVTGEWDEEEGTMIRELFASLLAKRTYAHVISHLPRHTYDQVASLLPGGTIVTCEGEDATKGPELARLGAALRGLVAQHPARPMHRLLHERLHGLATYQFGPAVADALLDGTTVRGKWPTGKIMVGIDQLAMLPTDRGLLSLTIDGAERVARTGQYCVEIEDFPVTGSIFAVGVKAADPQIRVGDEVAVTHAGEVRAVGVATMTGPEMVECERGEAVKVRHHA